jgi:hypothetical protein
VDAGEPLAAGFSRTEREFKVRCENCRRYLRAAPNVDQPLAECVLGLIEDVGGQVAELRHTAVSDRAADRADRSDLRREVAHFMFRMIGFDQPIEHPEEVGVVGDVRNKVDDLTRWIRRAFWGIMGGVGLIAVFFVEQVIVGLLHH